MNNCSHEDFDFSEGKLIIPADVLNRRLFLYSCPDCFDALWNQPREQDQKFLILWNGYPDKCKPSIPSILNFITPLDWAFAATYQALLPDGESSSSKSSQIPAIVILDLYSHQCPGSFAVNMRLALRDALPNVELFHAFDRYGNDFLKAVKFLSKPPDNPLTPDDIDRTKLNALRQAWLGYTAKSRDHHDINNIVGVQILQEAYGVARSEKLPAAEHALQQSIRWLNFAGEAERIEIKKEDQLKGCDIFLLDDRAEDGWLQILDQHLDNSGDGVSRLYYATNPQVLLDDLSGSGEGKWREFSQQESPNEAGSLPFEGRDRIFLIDLRLFISGRQEEGEFFDRLSKAVLDSEDPNISDDVQRDSQEIKLLISQGKKIAEQPENIYDQFLTLLARFTACKDQGHTWPIILFSSTGKRSIVDSLKDYKNIITCAPKPQCLAGMSGELVQGFSISLSQAFRQARRILTANDLIRQIHNIAEKYKGDNSTLIPGKNEHFHVELYLDEGDDQKSSFEVGGCYAIFKGTDRDNAIQSSWHFDDELVKKGIYFFYRNGTLPDIPDNKKPLQKYPARLDKFQLAFNSVEHVSKPVEIGFVRLRKRTDRKNSRAGIDPDNRELLRDILEAFLYEACPATFSADWTTKAFSFSVFGGTRLWSANADELKNLTYRFGVGVRERQDGKKKKLFVRSTYSDGLVPFVVDLESFRGSLATTIDRIWAVRLIYEKDHKDERNLGELQRVICLDCSQSFESKTILATAAKIGKITGRSDKPFRFLTPSDLSTNGKDIFVPPSLVNTTVTPNPEIVYFRYQATSNDDPKTGEIKWRATMLVPIDDQQIEQGTWTIVNKQDWQTLDPCPHSNFRPDYKALHYMADWALNRPDEFPFEGPLYFDEAIDEGAFSYWRHAGRALDAGDRPRALREVKEVLCTSADHQDLAKSTGKFVILRIDKSIDEKNLTREEFFKFVESLEQPLDPGRTAPTKPVNISDEVTVPVNISDEVTVVLSGFSDNIDETNVVSIVRNYLKHAGLHNLSLEGGRSKNSRNVTCKLQGLSSKQLEAIKHCKASPWKNVNS